PVLRGDRDRDPARPARGPPPRRRRPLRRRGQPHRRRGGDDRRAVASGRRRRGRTVSRLRVGLLANPTAAQGTAYRVGRQVGHLLRLAGISVVDVSGPSAAVARARAQEVRDTLTAHVVVGGDGTVALGAEIVAGPPVRLGVVPAGSGNDFARSLGLADDDPEGSTRTLLHALSRPVVTVDAIEITSTDLHGGEHRSLALGNVNLGFDALVNARANGTRTGRPTRYTAAVLRELRA